MHTKFFPDVDGLALVRIAGEGYAPFPRLTQKGGKINGNKSEAITSVRSGKHTDSYDCRLVHQC